MAHPESIQSICLVLTAGCNLNCGYCYQSVKSSAPMGWETLHRSLDLALDSKQREVEVGFLGGEPLLEFEAIRRAVAYCENRRPATKRVKYGISTNGMLLSDEMISFLDEHRFDTQISFDGVAEAQALRGDETFDTLDRLLDRIRTERPNFYHWHITISLTLAPPALGHLADSVDYFLDKGIGRMSINPIVTHTPDWREKRIEELDEQFERISESSVTHWRETGDVPFLRFRKTSGDRHVPVTGGEMCGIVNGGAITVNSDGEVYGCATMVDSYQEFGSRTLGERLRAAKMGRIDAPDFRRRLERFPETIERTAMFHDKVKKHSSYGRCGECRYVRDCTVCPVSIAHIPDNRDPHRVSDFACAYNMISLEHRERFPDQKNPREILEGPDGLEEEILRWKRLAAARKNGASAGSARRPPS